MTYEQAGDSNYSHRFKSSFGQCQCLWCGSRPDGQWCPVSKETREALFSYAARNGTKWRSKLIKAWQSGEDIGQELQFLRNVVGPSGLYRIPGRLIKLGA